MEGAEGAESAVGEGVMGRDEVFGCLATPDATSSPSCVLMRAVVVTTGGRTSLISASHTYVTPGTGGRLRRKTPSGLRVRCEVRYTSASTDSTERVEGLGPFAQSL